MKKIVPFLVLTVLFSFACGQSGDNNGSSRNAENPVNRVKPEKDSKVVARVNGVPIYEDELDGRPVNTAVTEEILYQEGLKRGLLDKYQDQVMAFQMGLIVRDVKNSILEELPPEKGVSDEQIEEYYKNNMDKYTNVRLQEINFPDKAMGEEIRQMALEGKQLQEIADKYSGQGGSDIKVSDLGYNKELTRYFSTLELDSVTDVIDKKNGTYSILKIVQVKEVPLSNARTAIKNLLSARNTSRAIGQYAATLEKENNVKVEILNNTDGDQ